MKIICILAYIFLLHPDFPAVTCTEDKFVKGPRSQRPWQRADCQRRGGIRLGEKQSSGHP